MKKKKWISCISILPGLIIFLVFMASCERTDYVLADMEATGKWKQYSTTNSAIPGNMIYDINVDQNGNIWTTCYGKGLARYQNGVWTSFNATNSLLLNDFTTALQPSAAGVLVGTTNGLSIRQTSGNWLYFIDSSVEYMTINAIKTDSKGNYWIGTEDEGYYFYDGSYFYHYLSGYDVNAIQEDKSGNIWIGTDHGLFKYKGTHLTTSSTPVLNTVNGLPSNGISSLYCDSKDRLWIGYYASTTASWLENNVFNQLNLMNGMEINTVWDIQEDKKGDIWFATEGSGVIRYDGVIAHSYKVYNTPLIDNDVYCICQDKEGNLWFGTKSKGVISYTLPLE